MNYLETLPLSSIAKVGKANQYAEGHPGSSIPFTGYPRAHPLEKNKLILVHDPLSDEPAVLEFKLEDILFVDEVPSAVTEAGESMPLVKLWIKRGAIGMILEPFEVNDQAKPAGKVRAAKERILQKVFSAKAASQPSSGAK